MADTQEPAEPPVSAEAAPTPALAPQDAAWWRAVPLWARIVFSSIVGVLVVALVVTLIVVALPHSKNEQACKDFEKAYNAFATSVKGKLGADVIRLEASSLADAITNAHAEAVGQVRSDLTDADNNSAGLLNGNQDQGTAFFYATSNVAKSCKADGAPIDLLKLG
jgi:hypothetical protein